VPFLTPPLTPTQTVRRCLCIPDHPLWLAAVSGALQVLTHAYNWEDIDGITAQQAADTAFDMVRAFYAGDCNMIGEIKPFCSMDAVPDNCLVMQGQTLLQADYPALAAVLPAAWKGGVYFTLPYMTSRTLVGNYVAQPTQEPIEGHIGGEATHTLTVAEMPVHSHPPGNGTAFISNAQGGYYLQQLGDGFPIGIPSVTGNTGGGEAHNNMQPYLVVVYGIVAL